MKKKIFVAVAIVIVLVCIYLIGSGFMKNSSACIGEYSVSEDCTEITMNIGVAYSAGYIRKVEVHQQENRKMCIDCYSAFGGINGKIGAKTVFTLSLNDDTNMIAIYRGKNHYEEVLQKDTSGVWKRIE